MATDEELLSRELKAMRAGNGGWRRLLLVLLLGAPMGFVLGIGFNRVLLGDYGGRSLLLFATLGAIIGAGLTVILTRRATP